MGHSFLRFKTLCAMMHTLTKMEFGRMFFLVFSAPHGMNVGESLMGR